MRELSRDDSGHRYSVDHIWAQDLIGTKKAIRKNYPGIKDEDIEKYLSYEHLLPNLQLLTPNENGNKNKKFFKEWDEQQHTTSTQKTAYYAKNYIPMGISFNYDNFIEFFEKRKELLKEAIEDAFPATFDDIVTKYDMILE